MFTEIVILIILIMLNAFFAASEIALISLNDTKIKTMADSGHKKAKLLHSLLSEPSRFLATIQIGITLAGFMASAFAAESFAGTMAQYLYSIGVPISQSILETISIVVITLILSYFTLVLGELVPKRIAMKKFEPIAMFAVTPLTILSKISAPFVKMLTSSTNFLVRLFGVDPNEIDEQVTEEEIRMMIDVGNESGAIKETEKIMINNVFEFNNKTVSDIMTHRSHVISIPLDFTLAEVAHVINTERYTRFPVFEDSIDNVVGILHAKAIINYIDADQKPAFALPDIIYKPYFVPTSRQIDELFKDMQKNKVHIAIVIDEYGGTAGIVTMEDLVEEIVGNIFDEYDVEEHEIEQIDENSYVVVGTKNLRELGDYLQIELPYDQYDTLNGFLIGQLDRIPNIGEQPIIEYEGCRYEVVEVVEKRISKVKLYIV